MTELTLGNLEHALEVIAHIETLVRSKEATVPEPGVFYRLTAFRAAHVDSPDHAREIIHRGLGNLATNPLACLEVKVAEAWLDGVTGAIGSGSITRVVDTCRRYSLHGRLRLFELQGFLPTAS
jgi:hypothetical protein